MFSKVLLILSEHKKKDLSYLTDKPILSLNHWGYSFVWFYALLWGDERLKIKLSFKS